MEPIKKLVTKAAVQILHERDNYARSLGITGTQMSVIDFLSNQPLFQASQNEIEHEFDIQRSTTTIMVQRMEKRGLVERIVNVNDKRQKLVKLTPKAAELVDKIHQYMKQDDLSLRQKLNQRDIKVAMKVLEVIKNG